MSYQDTTGSLCAWGYKKLGTQEATNDMYVTYSNDAYDEWAENDKGASLRASGGVYGGGSEALANFKGGETMESVVRRLTPLECERLQGFPDGWTDIGEWTDSNGKVHKPSDSPRYKALGNSIAVGYANGQSGFWCWLARRITAQYERQITMASLFDGIGGFPLAFQAAGAIPVWASEIEEFPIAVTKKRFPEDG